LAWDRLPAPSPSTPTGCSKIALMADLALALALAAEKTTAEEGRDIIIAMLVVGLVFLGVIMLGQLSRWVAHRRGRGH
jgi:heme/copper-type cytochrome/quinol oxidase subunit 2